MAGPVSMAPQGSTPKIPSAAPLYDAQMDIGKAVQGVGNAISAELKVMDKENDKEQAELVNQADVEYRTEADQEFQRTRETKDDFDNWGPSFREGMDSKAGEILKRYPNLSEKYQDKLLQKWDSHDRQYISRLDTEGARLRIDTKAGQLRDQITRSMAPALDPNSDMTPDQVDELMRQSLSNLELARKYLPPKVVDRITDELVSGHGDKSVIYQWAKRQAAKETEQGQGIATGEFINKIDKAMPFAGTGVSSRPMQSLDPLTQAQDGDSRGSAYQGPMPRIDKLPTGQPFNPEDVPRQINQSRPNFERGRMLLGAGQDEKPVEIPYFTGSKDKPNYPGLQYGAFTLLPHRVGENHRYGDTISINPLGATRQTPIEDPKVGRNRSGQLIHPENGNSTNIGCISVPDGEWGKVKGAVDQMWKEYGKTNVVLVNAPGVTQVMSRKQYDAMYGAGGTDTAAAPAPAAEPSKRFLALPGLKGTYGNDKTAFEDIAGKYGGKVDYLDGDPQWGGVGRNGATSPQVEAAVEQLAKGDYDGIIGFSAGAYNTRQILQSPEFQALPEEKRAKIQKVIAVGLSEEHVKDFKLDARYNPEVYGNIGASHLDAPRALAKQLGISPQKAAVEGIDARVDPAEYFKGKANVAELPLGMRISNNPGNLKYSGSDWQKKNLYGLVGPSTAKDQGDPQAQFANPLAGMASAVRLAQTKYNSHGLDTVEKIITDKKQGWTPGFTSAANNIAREMGVKPTDKIDLNDPKVMGKFMRALITQEHGEAGKLYDDALIRKGVEIAFGGKGAEPTRVADSSQPPGRMNLGGPKDDKVTSEPVDPVETPDDAAPKGFVSEADNDPGVAPGAKPAAAAPPANTGSLPEEASSTLPGEPPEAIRQAMEGPGAPQKRPSREGLDATERLLSRLSPESLIRLRNVAQKGLSDSGKVFESNAVKHAERTGEDWRHPVTGQTYSEWAQSSRQPQQLARGERLIAAAKRRYAATSDIAFLNEAEFAERLNRIEAEADPTAIADTYKLTDELRKDRNKVEEIKRLNAAQSVSGFSIKRGDNLPVYVVDQETGRVTEMKDPQGYAKPHPYVARAIEDIKGMGELGATIVETPEGLSINTSKVMTPAAKQQLWGSLFAARMAAQRDIGIPEDSRKMITQFEARRWLGEVPKGDPGAFEKHWKEKAAAIERMVGPENAPRVLREMRDFYVKGGDERGMADSDIASRTRKLWQAPGQDWATTGKMEATPLGPSGSMRAMRSLERADQLGRTLDGQGPGQSDPDRPAIAGGGLGLGVGNNKPTTGAGDTMNLPKKLMPDGARGPGVNMLPKINDQLRKYVIDNADNPLLRQAIDLKFGANAFNRILADQTKKGR